jgi:hypothetical protein
MQNPDSESKQVLALPPAERLSLALLAKELMAWLAGRSPKATSAPRATEHKHWRSFYWAFSKELGRECYRTWRGEVSFSVVLLGFVYVITRNPVDPKTILLGTAYSLSVFSLWHAMRTPWKLYSESRALHWGWGIFGTTMALGMIALVVWTVAWFYTLQPKVDLTSVPDGRDLRIADLESQVKSSEPFQEPKDSLRRRTIKLVTDLSLFWSRRPAPPQQPIQNPTTDDERKRNADWNRYWQENGRVREGGF